MYKQNTGIPIITQLSKRLRRPQNASKLPSMNGSLPSHFNLKRGQIGVNQIWSNKKALKAQGFQGFAVAGAEGLERQLA